MVGAGTALALALGFTVRALPWPLGAALIVGVDPAGGRARGANARPGRRLRSTASPTCAEARSDALPAVLCTPTESCRIRKACGTPAEGMPDSQTRRPEGAQLLTAVVGDLVRAPRRIRTSWCGSRRPARGRGGRSGLAGLVLGRVGRRAARRGKHHVKVGDICWSMSRPSTRPRSTTLTPSFKVNDVAHRLLDVLEQRPSCRPTTIFFFFFFFFVVLGRSSLVDCPPQALAEDVLQHHPPHQRAL